MAYQALYRKYRPQTFSDVVGQEHVTVTLQNELSSGKISHAYLFTGTRGTGKTSCAKILARAVNCLSPRGGDPCGECEMCRAVLAGEITDIVEIDAASNNSVDDVRELREQVNFSPAAATYRVYIIDEVHMLTGSAFNALLKTLEEPPAHVVFILATTEVHRLPATILSRCQRFDFRRIDPEKICARIQYIAEKEGFTVTDEAAALIAAAADGGMRDALSILDLCAAAGQTVDEEAVVKACAMAGSDYLLQLADCICGRDTEAALLLLDRLHTASVDMLRLQSELTGHFRDLMIVKAVRTGSRPIVCSAARLKALERQAERFDLREILAILATLQETAGRMQTGNLRAEMEMTLIRLCNPEIGSTPAALELRIAALEAGEKRPARPAAPKPEPQPEPKPEPQPESKPEPEPQPEDELPPLPEPPEEELPPEPPEFSAPAEPGSLPEPPAPDEPEAPIPSAEPTRPVPTAGSDGAQPVAEWEEILRILRTTCPLIAGVLAGSSAYIKGAYLLIDTQNSQFRTLVNGSNAMYRDHIRAAAQQVLGASYKLGPYRAPQAEPNDPLSALAQRLKNLKEKEQ